jgi:hypothetical protein
LPVHLLEQVRPGGAVEDRIDDQDVRDALQDESSELIPTRGRDQGVLRAENNCEMRVELTGQKSDDVHTRPGSMS